MTAAKKRTINMTEGPLFYKILLFILPLMATNLLQTLYNAADMMVVGLSSEPDAVGAIGITGSFINLVLNVFIGLATGANVVVARHLGAREGERASRTVHTALSIGLVLGVAGVIRGLGKSISSTVISLLGACAFRIAWVYTAFRIIPTLEVLYLSYPISWSLTALAHFTCATLALRHFLKTRKTDREIRRMHDHQH